MSKNLLPRNTELHRGDFLISNNREWKAIFQGDGNFVIYGWKPVWASDTYGSDVFRLCMQEDCNLVMYSKCGTPRWHTSSYRAGSHMCCLHLSDDGKLLVYKDAEEIWNSASSKGMK
ncbi:B-type lectin plumieribetin-like [Betta splendens]|uniref:B-type lectin plumieribetin-like n=1 Tax=Betta splendens TaxID=158456 RepID=A0A6P7M8Q8_BETSP|nr:B-type lectin plumieribetin-like [Betta splendens]XP_029003412.1 B-type lectin plumieribetin-like [Betta splendens]XP_029003459.1 B-type lectin plumieribetin-like [Betta splendens]XP_029003460.1 B-type lectin plumieribetin-like [Betta splendens]